MRRPREPRDLGLDAGDRRMIDARERGVAQDVVDRKLRRQKAYTLCVRAWDQIRRGVQFVRYNEGDADTIAPTLFAKGPRVSRSNGADTSAATTTSATPAAPAEPATPAEPAGSPAAPASADHSPTN